MFRRVLAGVAAGLLVAGVVVLVWVGEPWPAEDAAPQARDGPDEEEKAKDRLAEEAAKASITAQSRSMDAVDGQTPAAADPQAEAPPGFEPSPLPAREPTPPAGYAFVAQHEVERGPMTAADVERVSSLPPDWMASGAADVAVQAASSGRDWTFGWVKLAEDAGIGEVRAVLDAEGGEILGQSGDFARARLPGDTARLGAIAVAPRWPASARCRRSARSSATFRNGRLQTRTTRCRCGSR